MGTEGFSFPNDMHISWSLMIVIYPFITGLVAGSFVVTSLYHVFGRKELKPIARLGLVASFGLLLMAPLPLLAHLGHPERCMNIMVTPNFKSAMAAFGVVYSLYLIIVVVETWLVFRPEIIARARKSRGLKRFFYASLALWTYDTSEAALKTDHKVITLLAALGIPAACVLHGYVGFMFGSVKANYWWSTPLMPIIFLFSAIVSGIALILIVYQGVSKFAGRQIQPNCVQSLANWLWLFTIVTVTLELLEIVTLAYERNEEWEIISELLSGKLAFSFIGLQMVFGALIPIILLGVVVLMKPYLTNPLRNSISLVASLILLVQVFAMRWNVVIGGQLFSKSLRGFREPYVPEWFGREGIIVAAVILILPFIFMAVFNRILPLHDPDAAASGGTEAPDEKPVVEAREHA